MGMNKKPNPSIVIGSEDGGKIPVVIGKCPSCGVGDRSLIIIDFIKAKQPETENVVYLRCLCCDTILRRKVRDFI
jgi:hypothetical protein